MHYTEEAENTQALRAQRSRRNWEGAEEALCQNCRCPVEGVASQEALSDCYNHLAEDAVADSLIAEEFDSKRNN